MTRVITQTPQDVADAYKEYGSLKAIARAWGIDYRSVQRRYVRAVNEGLIAALRPGAKTKEQIKDPDHAEPIFEGQLHEMKTTRRAKPKKGQIKRYFVTSAQNNTHVPEALWNNVLALAKEYDAEIMVSRFTYMRSGIAKGGDKRELTGRGRGATQGLYDFSWDPKVEKYAVDNRVELAPDLVFCGEMNILPTAVRPLSDLQVYTMNKSGIFPHVKLAMESVPTGKHEQTKMNYTTGTVTLRNYIQKKAGLKAEFHHCYGGLIVEVDSDGDWFVRQINASSDGTLYDFDIQVKDGKVTRGHWTLAALWGDLHDAQKEQWVFNLIWGQGGMLDTLHIPEQHVGDILDFRSRTHWEARDTHKRFKRFTFGQDNVEKEVMDVGYFLKNTIYRSWSQVVVVDSNHDQQLGRWLRDENGMKDPVNAQYWLKMNGLVLDRIASGGVVKYMELGLNAAGFYNLDQYNVRFLEQDESYLIAGIECGMHGDLGPGGSRGNATSFAKMGRKKNIGHSHRAGIVDGVYIAGCCSILDPDWATGPNAWSHSHVLTYINGKRQIITMRNGKWRA